MYLVYGSSLPPTLPLVFFSDVGNSFNHPGFSVTFNRLTFLYCVPWLR